MTYQPYPAEQFGGLVLVGDPEEQGPTTAIDVLNVDVSTPGLLKTRDGYAHITASAAAQRFRWVFPFYSLTHGSQFIGACEASVGTLALRAFDENGNTIASQNSGDPDGNYPSSAARIGTLAGEFIYMADSRSANVYSWDGATFNISGVSPCHLVAVQSGENRLVAGNLTTDYSRVAFSGAGTPEVFGANDYVTITPGDGEQITALVTWRELVFAFKETKFAVFTGNSVAGDGTSIFNYRMVDSGVGVPGLWTSPGLVSAPAIAGTNGVYFLNRRGVWVTTGGDPVLISRAIDPIFLDTLPASYSGSALNQEQIYRSEMAWFDEKLYVSIPTGSATVPDRVLVWDAQGGQWTVWNIPMAGMTPWHASDGVEKLIFSYATGTNHIAALDPTLTTDDGAAMASKWQSAWFDPANGTGDTYVRQTQLWGTGSPTFSVFTDYGTTDASAAAVTLGTSPTVAKGFYRKSHLGNWFSHKISASSGAWSLSRLQHDIAWTRQF